MSDHGITITPHLSIKNAVAAIEFYKSAIGFEETMRLNTPDGKILHCSLRRGNAVLMLADEFPEMAGTCRSPLNLGGSTVRLHLNVADVDTEFAKIIAAGAKATMPVADMFWGSRYGQFTDPFGHFWSISTPKEEVSHAEAQKRFDGMYAKWKK